MSDVSVLGLGPMGTALAGALVKAKHRVTVWNRSPEKAVPLVALGALGAGTTWDAVRASSVVLVCLDGYRTTRSILGSAEFEGHLAGRTVVQLSTGTPKEARADAAWFKSKNAQYLDGAILAGPQSIGTSDGTIIYSGAKDTFDDCKPFLGPLGKEPRFVGDDVGAAATLDLAWLTWLYGLLVSTLQGAAVCEAEGVDLDLFASVLPPQDGGHLMTAALKRNAFDDSAASIAVHANALERICEQARDVAISSEVPDILHGLLRRAISAGHGNEDLAALIKVLRSTSA